MDAEDFVNRLIMSNLAQCYTILPAKVVGVGKLQSDQVIDVKPTLGRVWDDGDIFSNQTLYNVPVVFPSAGGGLLSFPVKEGNTVLLAFSMRPIDSWKYSDGDFVLPKSKRQLDVNDAIAIVGLYTTTTHLNPDPSNVVLKFAGSDVTLYDNGDVEVNAAKDLKTNSVGDTSGIVGGDLNTSVTGNAVVTTNGNLDATAVGDINLSAANVNITSGTLTHNGVNIGATHFHGGVTSGPNNTFIPS